MLMCCLESCNDIRNSQTAQGLGLSMDDEGPPILVPVVTGNIVLRALPYSMKDRLLIVRRSQGWQSWADMAYWVLENSELIEEYVVEWDDGPTGYIVCRDLPLEVRDQLARLKRQHGWAKWTDMVLFVLSELEDS